MVMTPDVLRMAQLAQLAQTPEGRRLIATQAAAKGLGVPQMAQALGGGAGVGQLVGGAGGDVLAEAGVPPAALTGTSTSPPPLPERKPSLPGRHPPGAPPIPGRKPPNPPVPKRKPDRESATDRFFQALEAVRAVQPPEPAIIQPVLPRGDRAVINPQIRDQFLALALGSPNRIPSLGELIGG